MPSKTSRLQVLLDPESKRALQRACEADRTTPSRLIRLWIREYLAHLEQAGDSDTYRITSPFHTPIATSRAPPRVSWAVRDEEEPAQDGSYEALLNHWHVAENAALAAEEAFNGRGQLAADPRLATLASQALDLRDTADKLFERMLSAHLGPR